MKTTTLKLAALAAVLTSTVFAAADEGKAPARKRAVFNAATFLAPQPQPLEGAVPAVVDAKPRRNVFDASSFLAPKGPTAEEVEAARVQKELAERARAEEIARDFVPKAEHDEAVRQAAERSAARFRNHVAKDAHEEAVRQAAILEAAKFRTHVAKDAHEEAVRQAIAGVKPADLVAASDAHDVEVAAALHRKPAYVDHLRANFKDEDGLTFPAHRLATKGIKEKLADAEDEIHALHADLEAFYPFLKTTLIPMAAAVADDQITALALKVSKTDVTAETNKLLEALKDPETRGATLATLNTNPADGLAGDDSEVAALLYRLSLLDALAAHASAINA